MSIPKEVRELFRAWGRKGGLVGGRKRARRLTPEQRKAIARRAAQARWKEEEVKQTTALAKSRRLVEDLNRRTIHRDAKRGKPAGTGLRLRHSRGGWLHSYTRRKCSCHGKVDRRPDGVPVVKRYGPGYLLIESDLWVCKDTGRVIGPYTALDYHWRVLKHTKSATEMLNFLEKRKPK